MKAILILLLLAALGVGGFFGYQYLEKEGKLPWQKPDGDEVVAPPSGAPDSPTAPKGTGLEQSDRFKVDPPKGDEIAQMYPMPEFQTLEKLTDNWTKLPSRAFPRKVITKKPVKLEIAPGAASTQPAGKEMTALGMENGVMILALDPASTARAKAPATATNIVDQIAERYEIFKKEQKDRVLAQRASEKRRRETASSAVASSGSPGTTPTVAVSRTKSPSSDPRFAPMVASIKARDSVEIEMKNIQSWRWGGKTKEGGQDYDYGLITYSVDTLFGTMDTEAMALIRNGKVQKWVYTGSGDEVP